MSVDPSTISLFIPSIPQDTETTCPVEVFVTQDIDEKISIKKIKRGRVYSEQKDWR